MVMLEEEMLMVVHGWWNESGSSFLKVQSVENKRGRETEESKVIKETQISMWFNKDYDAWLDWDSNVGWKLGSG